MEEKKKEIKFTLAKIILGLIILILILLFVRSCAKIGIYLELEEKKYYVYHSTAFPLPKAKAYDNKEKKLNIEITIYKNGKEQEGIDTNHIGDKYVVYYKTYKRNMYLKKQIEVEIIRNPNLLGYTLEGISNIWTKEDVILKFVPNENNIEKYCVKGECSTNNEFTIEKNETFETYIIDENGNKSLKQEYEVTNIDKESPIIKKVTEYNNKGKRYIGVQGEDTLSGVTEYSYDGGKTYSTSSTKEVSSGQIIIIKIKDLVGNESEEYKYTVGNNKTEEDTKAPTFIVTKNPEANSIGWNNTNVTLTIKAEDDISGVASYSFDNGNTWETTNTKEVSSTTTVTIKVKDNAGNISESKSVELKIDKEFPVIGGIGDDYNERMEITIKEDNLYNVELTKNGEDIINCPENNNCIFSKKTVEGRGLYQLKVTDKAGNETNTTFTIKAKGDTPKITGVINGNYYNESVTPYVEGEPIEEIKERTTLEKDNERIYSYEVGDTLEEDGVYDIQAKNRHNESDEVRFYIDKTLPELEIEKEGSELNITARDKNLETVVIFKEGIPVVCFAPEAGEIEGVTCEQGNYEEIDGKKVLEYTYILEEAIKYEVIATDKAGNQTGEKIEDIIYITYEDSTGIKTQHFNTGTELSDFIYANKSTFINHCKVVCTVPEITNTNSMFQNTQITSLDLSNFNTSNVTDMSYMFSGAQTTTLDLSSFDTNKVTDMAGMFYDSQATSLNLSNFNTSNVTSMTYMFSGAQTTTLDLSSFDTNKVTNMAGMFYKSKAMTLDLSSFNTSNVTNMSSMFHESQATTIYFSENFKTNKVMNMYCMFNKSQATTLNLSSFDVTNVTNMSHMFYSSKATTLDVSSFNPSKVTDMSHMFHDSQATTLNLSKFKTESVTNMGNMFSSSKATTLDVSSFNTSKVTAMSSMFSKTLVTTLNLSNFNTEKVTDMSGMFSSSKVTSLDLSSFNTSEVTTMSNMFNESQATSLDLSSFDISKVTDMSNMFSATKAIILDLSSFDTSNVTDMSNIFFNSQATTGYAKTQVDADRFNALSSKPSGLTFIVKP